MLPGSASRFWPLNSLGELPDFLFPKNAVGEAFFQKGAERWGCGRRAIRQALKALAKKYDVHLPESASKLSIEERDCNLVWAVASSPTARRNFRDLQIFPDSYSWKRARPKKVQGFAE